MPPGTETVLLVEDESAVRELVAQILGELGYTVLKAANGQEALALAQAHSAPIHLLLTDIVMPEMGGKMLAEQLAEISPETRVLFTSGYADNAIVHHGALEEGVVFIQKPFSPAGLARKVRQVLDTP